MSRFHPDSVRPGGGLPWAVLILVGLTSCAVPKAETQRSPERIDFELGQDSRWLKKDELPGIEDILQSVQVGVSQHDVGLVSSSEESGQNANMEMIFNVPEDFLDFLLSPRPHLGVHLNNAGDTTQGYAGLTWDFDVWDDLYGALSFGVAVHNGTLQNEVYDEKELGSRFLFRESIEIGYALSENHTLSIMLDHISNAGLADVNEGLDTVGVRLGYRF